MANLAEFGIAAQKYLPDILMTNFTKTVCTKLGASTDLEDKIRFAKTYNVDWSTARKCQTTKTLEACAAKFPTLDDFFARKILPKYTRPETTASNAIVSPADCHARTTTSTKTFTIKAANYTLATLLDLPASRTPAAATIYIFRLAPDQYHRIHSPVASEVVSIKSTGGAYKSVNPIMLNHSPVLQTNYRKIIALKNGMYLVAIGATCVGSINLSIKPNAKLHHGQDIGAFGFGGSCLALVVPQSITKIHTQLSENEKLLTVGKHIADFAHEASVRTTRTSNYSQSQTQSQSKRHTRKYYATSV